MLRCAEVTSFYQGHARSVAVSFGDKGGLVTISRRIDQDFDVLQGCHPDPSGVSDIIE